MEGQSQKRGVRFPEATKGELEQSSRGSEVCVIHQTSGESNFINNESL